MQLIGKLALSFVLVLSLPACGGTFVSFSPAPLAGEALNPITVRAVQVAAQDQPALLKANAVLVGWVDADDGDAESTSEAVRDAAARSGGTHVVVPGTRQAEVGSRDRPSPHGPDVATVRTTNSGVRYAVYRVPPEAWNQLPSDLGPWPLSHSQKP